MTCKVVIDNGVDDSFLSRGVSAKNSIVTDSESNEVVFSKTTKTDIDHLGRVKSLTGRREDIHITLSYTV